MYTIDTQVTKTKRVSPAKLAKGDLVLFHGFIGRIVKLQAWYQRGENGPCYGLWLDYVSGNKEMFEFFRTTEGNGYAYQQGNSLAMFTRVLEVSAAAVA